MTKKEIVEAIIVDSKIRETKPCLTCFKIEDRMMEKGILVLEHCYDKMVEGKVDSKFIITVLTGIFIK